MVESVDTGADLVDMGRFRIRALQRKLAAEMTKGEKRPDNIFTPEAMDPAGLKGGRPGSRFIASRTGGRTEENQIP